MKAYYSFYLLLLLLLDQLVKKAFWKNNFQIHLQLTLQEFLEGRQIHATKCYEDLDHMAIQWILLVHSSN